MVHSQQDMTSAFSDLKVFLREFNPDGLSSQPQSYQHRCSSAAEGIEHNPLFRTRRQNRNFAEVFGIGGEVIISLLRIFRQNIPYVSWLAALRMVAQEVITFLSEFSRSPR